MSQFRFIRPLLSLLLLSILTSLPLSQAQTPFNYVNPFSCSSSFRYDISSLDCQSCGTNQVAAWNDLTSCQCIDGYTTSSPLNRITFSCSACPASQSSNREGTRCMNCPGTVTSGQCDCAANQILVEKDAAGNPLTTKQCVTCPSGRRLDRYTCQVCNNPNMTVTGTDCTCPSFWVTDPSNTYCLTQTTYNTLRPLIGMKYRDVKSTDESESSLFTPLPGSTWYLGKNYHQAAVRCIDEQDRSACQTLGNLCSLQKYDKTTEACAQFLAIANMAGIIGTATRGFSSSTTNLGWKQSLPFLYWPDTGVVDSAVIQSKVVLDNPDPGATRETVGTLSFFLARYTFNGTFLGFEPLTTQLQLCLGDSATILNYLRFGVNYEKRCQLDLLPLLSSQTVFYDLYFVDAYNALFPVPVKIINYRASDGSQPNGVSLDGEVKSDSNSLNTRFFVVDNLSGRASPNGQTTILVYAKSIKLRVSMRGSSQEKITPPMLVIEYGERRVTDVQSGGLRATSLVTFQTQYVSDFSEVIKAGIALFSLSIIAGILWAIRRLCVWERKNHGDKMEFNLSFIVRLVIYLYSAMGTFFFISITAISFYIFLFYKGQKTVYLLLPETNSSDTELLGQMITVCFVAKLMEVVYKIYQQIGQDVFFIDWEKPKVDSSTYSGLDDEENHLTKAESVSVWRKVLIANQFAELQTTRIVSVPLTLFFMIFLMRALNLEYLATAQPTFSIDPEAAPLHPILLYAVTTFFLLIIIAIQLLFRKYIWHRFFYDDAMQFVDLCCTSNISCLIFDERYHSYYLHGKSVHSHADVSMEEMNLQLMAEQKTWTKQRGLVPGKDCFELFITPDFRAYYDKEYMNLVNRQLIQQQRINRTGHMRAVAERNVNGSQADRLNTNIESQVQLTQRLIKANQSLNQFISKFLEKSLPAFPYEFSQNTYWRKLLHLPPFIAPNAPCVMFEDEQLSFTKTVLRGIEIDLALLLITLYGVVTYAFQNELVSVFVCYLVDKVLVLIRAHYGRINIARKTLLDERFLV